MTATADPFGGFTIYQDPKDAPGMYVLRAWSVEAGHVVPAPIAVATPITAKSLEVLRASMVERGMVCVGRLPDDDRAILETWI